MTRDWKARLKKLTVGAIRNAVRGHKFSRTAERAREALVEEASLLEGESRQLLEAAVVEAEEVGRRDGGSSCSAMLEVEEERRGAGPSATAMLDVEEEESREAGPSTVMFTGVDDEVDQDWKMKLERLSKDEIMAALDRVGARDFSFLNGEGNDSFVEEVSKLGGEYRRALEFATMEKERNTRTVSFLTADRMRAFDMRFDRRSRTSIRNGRPS